MKIKILLFAAAIVLMSMYWVSHFEIAEAQATSTSTWEPLHKTPTPGPTNNYECPNTTPIGYGVVTPDIQWSINCEHCLIELTPQPTLPGGTPTVGPTSSPTPTNYPDHVTLSHDLPGMNPIIYYPPFPVDFESYWDGYSIRGADLYTYQHCGPGNEVCYQDQGFYFKTHCEWGWSDWYPKQSTAQILYISDSVLLGGAYTDCGFGTSGYCEADTEGYFSAEQLVVGRLRFVVAWTEPQIATHIGCHIEVSMTPFEEPEPTPVNSYCSTVPDGSGSNEEFGVGLPIIRVGPTTCAGIGSFELDLTSVPMLGEWLGIISFPGFEVCVAPLTFGTMEFLGMSFDLDFIAIIMAAVMLYRMFRT